MCEPVSIAMTATAALSAASAALNIAGQSSQRKSAIRHQRALATARNEQIANTRARASEAFLTQMKAEQERELQERAQISAEKEDRRRERIQKQATARVSSAEAGVSGLSLTSLVDDFKRQESFAFSRLNQQQQFRDSQRIRRQEANITTLKARNRSVQPFMASPVAGVDFISPILGIAKDTINVGARGGFFDRPGKTSS